MFYLKINNIKLVNDPNYNVTNLLNINTISFKRFNPKYDNYNVNNLINTTTIKNDLGINPRDSYIDNTLNNFFLIVIEDINCIIISNNGFYYLF